MTKGQVEAKISEIVSKFEVDYMGRGPIQIKTRIFDNVIFIKQLGFLTPAEHLLAEKREGIESIKKIRSMLFENVVNHLKEMINEFITTEISSIHSDVSTKTGEKVIIITFVQDIENLIEKL